MSTGQPSFIFFSVSVTLQLQASSSPGVIYYLSLHGGGITLSIIFSNLICVLKFRNSLLLLFQFVFHLLWQNICRSTFEHEHAWLCSLSKRPEHNDICLTVKLIQLIFFNQYISLNRPCTISATLQAMGMCGSNSFCHLYHPSPV